MLKAAINNFWGVKINKNQQVHEQVCKMLSGNGSHVSKFLQLEKIEKYVK